MPQGSTLSHILFNCYINDIPKTQNVKNFLFADDTAFTVSSLSPDTAINRLNIHLRKYQFWCNKWKIKVNPAKSSHIHFNTLKSKHTNKPILLNKTIIPRVNSHKFLGVTLTPTLSWNKHISIAIAKAHSLRNKLAPILTYKPLTHKTKLRIIHTIIIPTLTYACPVTFKTTKKNIQKMEKLYNTLIRAATNSNRLVSIKEIKKHHNLGNLVDKVKKNCKQISQKINYNQQCTYKQTMVLCSKEKKKKKKQNDKYNRYSYQLIKK